MLKTLALMFLTWVLGYAQYPGTTKEWDFMIETGQDNADVNGGMGLTKGGALAALNGKGTWRIPVITALGWGFEGDEIA
jgi:hypothetical protein